MSKSKESFVNRIEIRITIPEDELHPISRDPLPHKVELTLYKTGSEGDKVPIANVTFKEGNPELKKNFLLRISHLIGVMIEQTAFEKPLKRQYVRDMLQRLEDVEVAYREKKKGE